MIRSGRRRKLRIAMKAAQDLVVEEEQNRNALEKEASLLEAFACQSNAAAAAAASGVNEREREQPAQKSSKKRWSAEEDAALLEKYKRIEAESSYPFASMVRKIAQEFTSRSACAISKRLMKRLKEEKEGIRRLCPAFCEAPDHEGPQSLEPRQPPQSSSLATMTPSGYLRIMIFRLQSIAARSNDQALLANISKVCKKYNMSSHVSV